MKTPVIPIQFAVIALGLACGARAGSFSTDFSSPPGGATAYGSAFLDSTGGANDDGGVLKLTTAAGSQVGSFVIDDLDPGLRVNSFVASFNVRMGGGSTPPADGISFNFATDIPNGAFGTDGTGSGLTIIFDAYENVDLAGGDNSEGPEVRILVGASRTLVARRKLTNQLQTGAGFVPVTISYTPSGTISLAYNNAVLFTNLFVFGPFGTGARFGIGAKTGSLYQDQFIDDLNITTTTVSRFYVKGQVTPFPAVGIAPSSTFQVVLQDFSAAVDTGTVTMTLNGAGVTPTVSKTAGITTISYDPPGLLLADSVNLSTISFSYLSDSTIDTLTHQFSVAAAPLWSLAPGSRVYLPPDNDQTGGTTPLYRSLAVSPLTNHLYIVSRTNNTSGFGISVNVLDSNTGADLYGLNTNGIQSGGTITLLGVVAADDGAIYACDVTTTNGVVIYKWANDNPSTAPAIVYASAFTGALSNSRWGDSLAVRGGGATTQLILDSGFVTNVAVLTATDGSAASFTPAVYAHSYDGGNTGMAIGRSLQFGPTNTYFLKKRPSINAAPRPPVPSKPLQLLRYDAAPGTTSLVSATDIYGQVGPVTVDLSKGLAAGILFVTNMAAADRLIVYDISTFTSPLPVAQYDFPVTHHTNNNYIGQVVFGPDKIFALSGNNGVMAVPASPPSAPRLKIAHSGSSVVLSWTNTVPGFMLQSTPVLSPPAWSTVGLPVVVNSNLNLVIDSLATTNFYRLVKP